METQTKQSHFSFWPAATTVGDQRLMGEMENHNRTYSQGACRFTRQIQSATPSAKSPPNIPPIWPYLGGGFRLQNRLVPGFFFGWYGPTLQGDCAGDGRAGEGNDGGRPRNRDQMTMRPS